MGRVLFEGVWSNRGGKERGNGEGAGRVVGVVGVWGKGDGAGRAFFGGSDARNEQTTTKKQKSSEARKRGDIESERAHHTLSSWGCGQASSRV